MISKKIMLKKEKKIPVHSDLVKEGIKKYPVIIQLKKTDIKMYEEGKQVLLKQKYKDDYCMLESGLEPDMHTLYLFSGNLKENGLDTLLLYCEKEYIGNVENLKEILNDIKL